MISSLFLYGGLNDTELTYQGDNEVLQDKMKLNKLK